MSPEDKDRDPDQPTRTEGERQDEEELRRDGCNVGKPQRDGRAHRGLGQVSGPTDQQAEHRNESQPVVSVTDAVQS